MINKADIFIPNNIARKSLSIRLNLAFHVDMQDWEWEVSDYTRIEDFIEEYDRFETTDDEKMSLMEIILDCLNDLLEDGKEIEFDKYFVLVQKQLYVNTNLHLGTVNYWSKSDFKISSKL